MNQLIIIILLFIIKKDCVVSSKYNDESYNVHIENDEPPNLELPKYNENGDILVFPRIIGGSPAQLGEFRGQVSIQTVRNQHFCGGTLIDLSHVLTAAHCLTDDRGVVTNPNTVQVMADSLSITTITVSRQVQRARLIFIHHQYNIDKILNDIAIIRLVQPFIITPTFNPINRTLISPAPVTSCNVAGWGYTIENNRSSSPSILLRVNVEVIETRVCNSSYSGLIHRGMFCAGTMSGGRDACQGDSGGGLICGGNIVGIVSFGNGCGRRNFPGVYTDVSIYNAWINQMLNWSGNSQSQVPIPTTVIPRGDGTLISLSIYTLLLSVALPFIVNIKLN